MKILIFEDERLLGCINALLRRQGNTAQVSVFSFGAEMSRENLKNISKRFYGGDKARTMDHSYGLGLSIARSIIPEHGGKIWAESNSGANTFCIQLPTLPQ